MNDVKSKSSNNFSSIIFVVVKVNFQLRGNHVLVFSIVDRSSKLNKNVSKVHFKSGEGFYKSTCGFFDLLLSKKFSCVTFRLKHSRVVDTHRNKLEIVDRSVIKCIKQDSQKSKFRFQHFASSWSSSFNEKLKSISIFHQLLNIGVEDSFIKRIISKASFHKESSWLSENVMHNGNI